MAPRLYPSRNESEPHTLSTYDALKKRGRDTRAEASEPKARLETLGVFGLLTCCDKIIDNPWLRQVLAIQELERQKRGLERRTRDAHVGAAKPMADLD